MKTKSYREIDRCRICGNEALAPILSLGRQALIGSLGDTDAFRDFFAALIYHGEYRTVDKFPQHQKQ
jgi:hypothetical protein